MIPTLLLYGATGDLAGRFLLPGLAALLAARELPEDFRVVATGRSAMSDDAFRKQAAGRLAEYAGDVPAGVRAELLGSIDYRQADAGDAESVHRALGGTSGPVAAYLALPPHLFTPAITALSEAGLPPGSRIAVEKPFGESLHEAIALDALLARVAGPKGERMIFRVDHVLGMSTVQNLLRLRFANRMFDQVWNSTHIEQVEILWEETLALEGRAGYFDGAGALKDVLQNHMLQVLSLVAMEPPSSLDEHELRDRKLAALRSVRPLTAGDIVSRTRRARYTAGRVAGDDGRTHDVPDYAAEEGVDVSRGTETFVELKIELDSPRWDGTLFVLRAGKALAAQRKGVVIRFRAASNSPFAEGAEPNELWIGIDGPTDVSLLVNGAAGRPPAISPLVLTSPSPAAELPPYANVLLDVLRGGSAVSVSGAEAEQSWRIVTPVLQAWTDGQVALEHYAAGSEGPRPGSAGQSS